jgi:hypothetical protein
MTNNNKSKIFSWLQLQEESISNSFDDPISILDLESKSKFNFNDFSIHSDKLEAVLEQAIPKALQKLAVQHATAALGEDQLSFLNTWQPKLRVTVPDASQDLFTSTFEVDRPYSYPEAFNMTSASAPARFNALATRFNTDGLDLSNLQEIMLSNANIDQRVLTAISYWGSTHDYHTAVTNFSTLFIGLLANDLHFLMDYTTLDETGALFLFLKFLTPKLGPFLSSRLILPLYQPGAFIAFLEASIYEARKHMARSM